MAVMTRSIKAGRRSGVSVRAVTEVLAAGPTSLKRSASSTHHHRASGGQKKQTTSSSKRKRKASGKAQGGTLVDKNPSATLAAAVALGSDLVGFPPLVPEIFGLSSVVPHTMILGSMPGVTSLVKQEYYGYKMNSFWPIVGAALGFDAWSLSYEERTRRAVSAGYILWDVIYGCDRKGSLDSNIKGEVPNKLEELVQRYPSVHRVVINGKAAAGFFKKYFADWLQSGSFLLANDTARDFFAKGKGFVPTSSEGDQRISLFVMPSTSPAFASLRHADKERIWLSTCFNPTLATP